MAAPTSGRRPRSTTVCRLELRGRALLPCTPVTGEFDLYSNRWSTVAPTSGRSPGRDADRPLMLLPLWRRRRRPNDDDDWLRWRISSTARDDGRTARPRCERFFRERRSNGGAGSSVVDPVADAPLMLVPIRPGSVGVDMETGRRSRLRRAGDDDDEAAGGRRTSRMSVGDARKAAAEAARQRTRLRQQMLAERKRRAMAAISEEERRRLLADGDYDDVTAGCKTCQEATNPFGGGDEFVKLVKAKRVSFMETIPEHDCPFVRQLGQLDEADEADDGDDGRTGRRSQRSSAGSDAAKGSPLVLGAGGSDAENADGSDEKYGSNGEEASALIDGIGNERVDGEDDDGLLQRLLASASEISTSENVQQLADDGTSSANVSPRGRGGGGGRDVRGDVDDDDDAVSVESTDEHGRPIRRRVAAKQLKTKADGDGRERRQAAVRKHVRMDDGDEDVDYVKPEIEETSTMIDLEPRTVVIPGLPDTDSRRRRTTVGGRHQLRPSCAAPGRKTIVTDEIVVPVERPKPPKLKEYRGRYRYHVVAEDRLQKRRLSDSGQICDIKPLLLNHPVKAGRFELPIDLTRLASMEPADYLRECCRLTAHDDAVYRLMFERHLERHASSGPGLRRAQLRMALRDVIPVDVSDDDVRRLFVMSGIDPDRGVVECNLFIGIASLAARLLQHWDSTETTSNDHELKPSGEGRRSSVQTSADVGRRTVLESTDMSELCRKLDGIDVNPAIRQLLDVI